MWKFSWIPLYSPVGLLWSPSFTDNKQDSLALSFPLQFYQLPGFWKPVSWKASCHHVVPVPLQVVRKLRVRELPLDVLNFSCSTRFEETILGRKKKNIPPDENKNLTCKNWKEVKHHYPILKENKQTNSTGYRWLEDAMPSRVLSSCPLSPCIVWAGGKTDFSFCLAVSSYTLLTVSMVRFQEQLHYTKRGEKIKKIKI